MLWIHSTSVDFQKKIQCTDYIIDLLKYSAVKNINQKGSSTTDGSDILELVPFCNVLLNFFAIIVATFLLHGKQLIVDRHYAKESVRETDKRQSSRVDESGVLGSIVAYSIGCSARNDTKNGNFGCLCVHLIEYGQWILGSFDGRYKDKIHAKAQTSKDTIGKQTDGARSIY